MASQQQSGRAASRARRQLQVNGKGRSAAATAPTRQPNRRERAPVPVANPTPAPAPQAAAPVAPSFAPAPASSMPKPKRAQKSASRLRRESLAARGKRADRSNDRKRDSEMAMKRRSAAEAKTSKGNCGCGGPCCQEAEAKAAAAAAPAPAPSLSAPASTGSVGVKAARRKPLVNASTTGRMLSRARRAAMAGRGKAGLEAHGKNSSASLARQANPEISARDLARVVRESRSKGGARGNTSSAPIRTRRPRNAAEAKAVSGTNVSHSEKITGDETGLCRDVTGTEYFSSDVFTEFCQTEAPQVPQKVSTSESLSGRTITTSSKVGRSGNVTGDEQGSCRTVTGSEYVGREQFDDFCSTKQEPGSAKVSFSQTTRGQIVSGSKPARSEQVTGDEAGTCSAVTGTPYTGAEQINQFCKPDEVKLSQVRNQNKAGNNVGRDITGQQPGFAGLTGTGKGVCSDVSGTTYIGTTEQQEVCAVKPAQVSEPDFPQPLTGAPWGDFSVVPPIHASQQPQVSARENVTGTRYEKGLVSGTFSMGEGKITGTEQFRFGDRKARAAAVVTSPKVDDAKVSRVTGEGLDAGLKITGNDWGRGDHVTGTEGTSSVKRNPTRRGPISAMPSSAPEQKKEVVERNDINVTGGSGSTESGALVTLSGGARG